eukprot:CAMPEP_0177768682 /NCGR_PEP_ID=MMETSP0491_2-20121128/9862_1 /TAXON_ID=63592 /ORGANISM="Tetraselmis chuii, Strain PLY429" /LENGTH=179 /DNA_ID=CAMNT_0019285527 /DNA_START=188 /DNA_END=727 /DNA_ORIENTATION=-
MSGRACVCSAFYSGTLSRPQRVTNPSTALRVAPLRLPARRSPALARKTQRLHGGTHCEAGAPAEGEMTEHHLVAKLSGEELEVAIQERTRPLVIDFYATWCGPCVLMAKELEKVAEELGEEKVRVVKVDTEENPLLSNQLQIQGLPTLVFVSTDTSKPALRTEGLLPAATIKEIIEKEL